MPYNIPKLDLDTTGLSVNNRIIDEPHTLSGAMYRSIAPSLGPFFSESLQVRDGATLLSRGIDYQTVELHQEATLKYGKEISSVILVISPTVNSEVTVTYQALGGHYAYSDDSIANVYEAVISDSRPVGWDKILNKPSNYLPTVHRHLLEDVYGFEPVIDVLERIKRAVTIGQVDIILEILANLKSDFEFKRLGRILPVNKEFTYDNFLFFITQHKLFSPVSVKALAERYTKGTAFTIYVDTTMLPPNTPIYWEFYNSDALAPGSSVISGIKDRDGIINSSLTSYFRVYIPIDDTIPKNLYIGVRLDLQNQEYDAVTYRLYTDDAPETNSLFGIFLKNRYIPMHYVTENNCEDDELRLYYSTSYTNAHYL